MKLVASKIDLLLGHVRSLLDRLEIPSRDEYAGAAFAALRDLRSAGASSWRLAHLSFRPVFLLLCILGRQLAILARLVARHTVKHGWVAAREGYFQLRTGTVWFVNFQRGLSPSAKYAEVGALAVGATLWLLRRHVRRNRYAERAAAWYRERKRRAWRKYQNFVERVARTSSFLASLLPHILYALLFWGLKRMAPSFVTYLATKTYLISIIGYWRPLYLSFSVLRRLTPLLKAYETPGDGDGDGGAVVPSKLKEMRRKEMEMNELRAEAVDLLKYWVVYAILLAIVRTAKLLPFFGHVLDVTADDASKSPPPRWFFGKKKTGFYSKLRLPKRVVEEITLAFLIWFRFMPSTITGGEANSPRNTTYARDLDKQQRPVDILFKKMSPYVLSTMNSSAFLTKRALGDSRNEGSTFLSAVIQKLRSVLDLLVLVRLISKGTQEWLINFIVESSALAPAMATLLMPSYFTSFGVIYVSLVVPAGYSATSCNEIQHLSPEPEAITSRMDDVSRYLQFWLVHAAVASLLGWLAPFLAWVPLSTHATWLLWAFVQLESSTRGIYGWLEQEFDRESLEENVLVRLSTRIISALPSNDKDYSENTFDANSDSAVEGNKSKVE